MLKKTIATLAVLAGTAVLPAAAQADVMTYYFQQDGYAEAASVNGWFRGDDLDLNGQLSFVDGEVSDFNLAFSGNSVVDMFSLGFADLIDLVYNLDGLIGELFDFEGIEAESANGDFLFVGGPGLFFEQCGIGFDCAFVAGPVASDFSQELISVDVPEPATLALMLTGLIGAGFAYRRRIV